MACHVALEQEKRHAVKRMGETSNAENTVPRRNAVATGKTQR
jgi:hypothetical protein